MSHEDELREWAEHGLPRGSDTVWSQAQQKARNSSAATRRQVKLQTTMVVLIAVVPITLVLFFVNKNDAGDPISSDTPVEATEVDRPTTRATTSTTTADQTLPSNASSSIPDDTTDTSDPSDAPDPQESGQLTDRYLSCVNDRGFELRNAQIFVTADGKPDFAKTDVDVPADIHVPCFTEIGGQVEPGTSSWNPDDEVQEPPRE